MAGNAALGLWVRAGAWCGANLTDGALPKHMIGTFGAQARDAKKLVSVGLWVEIENGYQFHEWSKMQPSKAEVEAEREANRQRQKEWRERNKKRNAVTDPVTDGVSHKGSNDAPTRPDPTRPSNEEPNGSSKSEPERPDVQRVIEAFSELLKANDVKHKPGKTWKDAARLLIDRDGYTPDQILYVARYATGDEFWKSNILSLPKLREKFEALKIKAQAANNPQPQRMDHSARAKAKEADMLARFQAAQEQQPHLGIEA